MLADVKWHTNQLGVKALKSGVWHPCCGQLTAVKKPIRLLVSHDCEFKRALPPSFLLKAPVSGIQQFIIINFWGHSESPPLLQVQPLTKTWPATWYFCGSHWWNTGESGLHPIIEVVWHSWFGYKVLLITITLEVFKHGCGLRTSISASQTTASFKLSPLIVPWSTVSLLVDWPWVELPGWSSRVVLSRSDVNPSLIAAGLAFFGKAT